MQPERHWSCQVAPKAQSKDTGPALVQGSRQNGTLQRIRCPIKNHSRVKQTAEMWIDVLTLLNLSVNSLAQKQLIKGWCKFLQLYRFCFFWVHVPLFTHAFLHVSRTHTHMIRRAHRKPPGIKRQLTPHEPHLQRVAACVKTCRL